MPRSAHSCRNEYLIRVNIYARRGIPTSALPHLVGDHCAAFPTILIGNPCRVCAGDRWRVHIGWTAPNDQICAVPPGCPEATSTVQKGSSGTSQFDADC